MPVISALIEEQAGSRSEVASRSVTGKWIEWDVCLALVVLVSSLATILAVHVKRMRYFFVFFFLNKQTKNIQSSRLPQQYSTAEVSQNQLMAWIRTSGVQNSRRLLRSVSLLPGSRLLSCSYSECSIAVCGIDFHHLSSQLGMTGALTSAEGHSGQFQRAFPRTGTNADLKYMDFVIRRSLSSQEE